MSEKKVATSCIDRISAMELESMTGLVTGDSEVLEGNSNFFFFSTVSSDSFSAKAISRRLSVSEEF